MRRGGERGEDGLFAVPFLTVAQSKGHSCVAEFCGSLSCVPPWLAWGFKNWDPGSHENTFSSGLIAMRSQPSVCGVCGATPHCLGF